MKNPTNAEQLTNMIARRETEIQRQYDALLNQRALLLGNMAQTEYKLREVSAGLALCHRRAAEQGRTGIL